MLMRDLNTAAGVYIPPLSRLEDVRGEVPARAPEAPAPVAPPPRSSLRPPAGPFGCHSRAARSRTPAKNSSSRDGAAVLVPEAPDAGAQPVGVVAASDAGPPVRVVGREHRPAAILGRLARRSARSCEASLMIPDAHRAELRQLRRGSWRRPRVDGHCRQRAVLPAIGAPVAPIVEAIAPDAAQRAVAVLASQRAGRRSRKTGSRDPAGRRRRGGTTRPRRRPRRRGARGASPRGQGTTGDAVAQAAGASTSRTSLRPTNIAPILLLRRSTGEG